MAHRFAQYPDNSSILAQKTEGRRQRAVLSFAEKLVLLDALKERVEPIVQSREMRQQQQSRLMLNQT
jgi:hypothetical protein